MAKNRWNVRLAVQLAFTALTNGYVSGFLGTGLYKGRLKSVCLPGLNCYSCPGALGSCPIGALQAVLTDRRFSFSYYVVGTLLVFGALFGRLVCGFLCPFGLVQDLLHRIPGRKWRKFPFDRVLRYAKYLVLALFVIWLPLFAVNAFGQGSPWFCQYICPSGTLMGGVPQLLMSDSLRSSIGWLFGWKMLILVAIVVLSVFNYRPFCKYLCPLGAIYAMTNRWSIYRYSVDQHSCTGCGGCASACGMGVDMARTQNHPECIRCGTCARACPHGAISVGWRGGSPQPGSVTQPRGYRGPAGP